MGQAAGLRSLLLRERQQRAERQLNRPSVFVMNGGRWFTKGLVLSMCQCALWILLPNQKGRGRETQRERDTNNPPLSAAIACLCFSVVLQAPPYHSMSLASWSAPYMRGGEYLRSLTGVNRSRETLAQRENISMWRLWQKTGQTSGHMTRRSLRLPR